MPLTRLSYRKYRGEVVVEPVEVMLERARTDATFPYPYPILASMVGSEIEDNRTGGPISVTQLLSACVRCAVLQRYVEYTESIDNIWGRWMGSMYHMLMEQHPIEGDLQEVRFYANVPGIEGAVISGKPDIVRPRAGQIIDLKTRKKVPTWDEPFEDHVTQLNFYRWLVNHHNEKAIGILQEAIEAKYTSLVIWYVDPETVKPLEVRKKIEVATKPGAKYPTRNIKVPDVWDDAKVEAELVPRYKKLHDAFEAFEIARELPPYPPGIDPMPNSWWIHRFSPVAEHCLKHHFTGDLTGVV